MKCTGFHQRQNIIGSLPVRGAWIEIAMAMQVLEKQRRRSPCGERGLK